MAWSGPFLETHDFSSMNLQKMIDLLLERWGASPSCLAATGRVKQSGALRSVFNLVCFLQGTRFEWKLEAP